MNLIVVDPGLRATGAALYRNGALAAVLLARAPDVAPPFNGPDIAAIAFQVKQVTAWMMIHPRPDRVVFEWPSVYNSLGRAGREVREEDPNDLLPLTAINGGIMAGLAAFSIPCEAVLARLWTQGTPKKIRQARYLEKISPADKAVIETIKPAGLRHNVVDACHLGRWVLDRSAARG